jgi:FKBP-type peptidyl-prolyl cis-trans isomerase
MKLSKLITLFLLLPMAFSCKENVPTAPEEEQIETYLKTKGLVVTEKTTDGLRYIRTKENPSGTLLTNGKTVTLNYTGKFLSDKKFDSGSFSFVLGGGQVIKGFDQGIAKMRVGENATLVFPSGLGYGSQGSGSIPANSPLVFDIEILSVK